MRWKDFLNYYRTEQLTINLLLALIFIALILNLSFIARKTSPIVINQNDSLIAAFDKFYNGIEVDSSTFRNNGFVGYKEVSPTTQMSNNKSVVEEKRYSSTRSQKLAQGEKIFLNKSDTTDWKKVPGIGSAYASRIVKYRNLLGGYLHIEQLKEVYGMDDERYSQIIPFVEIDAEVIRVKINERNFKELLQHPYLNYKQVQAVVNLRNKKGDIKSLSELSILNEFTNEDILRLEPYVEF